MEQWIKASEYLMIPLIVLALVKEWAWTDQGKIGNIKNRCARREYSIVGNGSRKENLSVKIKEWGTIKFYFRALWEKKPAPIVLPKHLYFF